MNAKRQRKSKNPSVFDARLALKIVAMQKQLDNLDGWMKPTLRDVEALVERVVELELTIDRIRGAVGKGASR